MILPHRRNRGERTLADDRSLQLARQRRIDHRAGRARIKQEIEGAGAVDHRRNDNQVLVAQLELYSIVGLRCSRRQRAWQGRYN